MREISVWLDDDEHDALEEEAASAHISVAEYAALVLKGRANHSKPEQSLGWQAEDLLVALRRFGARPGSRLGIETLYSIWLKLEGVRKPEDLQTGANELGDRDLADVDAASLTLTDKGYARISE